MQEGVGSAAERQRKRNEELEGRVEGLAGEVKGVAGEVEALGKEVRRRLSAIEGAVTALGRDDPQGTGAGHAGAGPQPEGSGEAQGRCGAGGKEAAVEAVHAAGVPRPGDAGACPGRRGDIRGGVAADRRVAGAEGRATPTRARALSG